MPNKIFSIQTEIWVLYIMPWWDPPQIIIHISGYSLQKKKRNNLSRNKCKKGQARWLSEQTAYSTRGNIKEVALFSLEKWKVRGVRTVLYKFSRWLYATEGNELFKKNIMLAKEQISINQSWIKLDWKLEKGF